MKPAMNVYGGKKSRRRSSRKYKGKKNNKPCNMNTRFFRRVLPKRIGFLRGGGGGDSVAFPASFSNANISVSPQSYLPYNNFANDPNYSVISSSNTGPFLTGVSSGGSKRLAKTMKRRKRGGSGCTRVIQGGGGGGCERVIRGGGEESLLLSDTLNNASYGKGIMNIPHLNELSGVAGVMSGFSNTGYAYNSASSNVAPLA